MATRPLVVILLLGLTPLASAAWSGLTYQASTYLGGTGLDTILAVTTDATGAIYVAGSSTSIDLPTTAAALQGEKPGGPFDASGFVAKVEPDGALAWVTYLGGSLGDQVEGIAVDGAGRVLVTGTTRSSDFPTTAEAFRPSCRPDAGPSNACLVGFLSVLSADGGTLLWSTRVASTEGPVGVSAHAIAFSGGLACVAGADLLPEIAAEVPEERSLGFLFPEGAGLAWFPPTRGAPLDEDPPDLDPMFDLAS